MNEKKLHGRETGHPFLAIRQQKVSPDYPQWLSRWNSTFSNFASNSCTTIKKKNNGDYAFRTTKGLLNF
ncbi:MAG: hypothetical protein LWW89_06695 [Oryzomicrobium sp.]|nr:hypothetical protein [Oryzomicrobium sp.]